MDVLITITNEDSASYSVSAKEIASYDEFKALFNSAINLCGCPGLKVIAEGEEEEVSAVEEVEVFGEEVEEPEEIKEDEEG
jgi:hypothetical protein